MTYDQWNAALCGAFFREEVNGLPVRLSVDPDLLLRLARAGDPAADAAGAERSLVTAVAAKLRKLGDKHGPLLWTQRGKPPPGLAILAVEVLAAQKMHDDHDDHDDHDAGGAGLTDRAYWPRLRQLFRANGAEGESIVKWLRDAKAAAHQALWREMLGAWANGAGQHQMDGGWGRACLPADEAGGRRHVALPLSQVLLREADRPGLWDFFAAAGFAPHERVGVAEVEEAVGEAAKLKPFVRRLLGERDGRREVVLGQIAEWLAEWDGRPRGAPAGRAGRPTEQICATLGRTFGSLRLLVASAGEGARKTHSDEIEKVRQSLDAPAARPIVLVRDGIHDNFYTPRRKAGPGDSVVVLFRDWYDGSRWTAGMARAAEGGVLRRFGRDACEGREVCAALPPGWQAASGRLRAPLPDGADLGTFADLVTRHAARRLRAVGGLKLTRTVWMADAAPDVILREADGTEAARPAEMKLRVKRGGEQSAPDGGVIFTGTGGFEVWAPSLGRRLGAKVRIGRPRHLWRPAAVGPPAVGWEIGAGCGWPLPGVTAAAGADDPRVAGAAVIGPWPPADVAVPVSAGKESCPPDWRSAVARTVARRRGRPDRAGILAELYQARPASGRADSGRASVG